MCLADDLDHDVQELSDESALASLDQLQSDPAFCHLTEPQPRFSVVRALGVEGNELAHSRLLAVLLSPKEQHGLGSTFLRHFLDKVARAWPEGAQPEWYSLDLERARATRELDRVDITLDVPGKNGESGLILGIENKIWAGEGPDQIHRYQQRIERRFGGHRNKAIVFLTPTGRAPRTAGPVEAVPCVPLSYHECICALSRAIDERSPTLEPYARHALDDVVRHVQEDIVGDDQIKNAVAAVFRDHPKAAALLVEYRPRLDDICEEYEARIRKALKREVSFWYHPGKGRPREANFNVSSSGDLEDLTILFSHDPSTGRLPAVSLLLERETYDKAPGYYDAYARHCNRNAPDGVRFDPKYTPVAGWTYWRRVLIEDESAPARGITSTVFDDKMCEQAVRRAIEYVKLIEDVSAGFDGKS